MGERERQEQLLVREREQVFAYGVLGDAAKRSIDALRFVDALLVALLAVQAAILAIYVEEFRARDAAGSNLVRVMDVALLVATVALVLTFASKDVPNGARFARDFRDEPSQTRDVVMTLFLAAAARNDVLRSIKLGFFAVALVGTLWDVLAATGFFTIGFWQGGWP